MPEFTNYFVQQRPQDLYGLQLQRLMQEGDKVEVRGRTTIELLNITTHLEKPTDPCILIPARRWNPWLALSEGLWILAGRNDVEALKPYNRNIVNFSDNGETLYGAYGKRIYGQIDDVVERLKKDPSDRRAVLQIWNNVWYGTTNSAYMGNIDLTTDSKDPPCNNLVYFKLRNERLHMTVINRSNDIHWGLYAVNLPTFQMLQQYIAARLGVEVGTQTHFSNSLHYYTDDEAAIAITERMIATGNSATPKTYPIHELMFKDLTNFVGGNSNFSSWCSMVLEDKELGVGAKNLNFLRFAQDFLRQYREHEWHPQDIRYAEEYADWIHAGEIFVSEVWRDNRS